MSYQSPSSAIYNMGDVTAPSNPRLDRWETPIDPEK